MQGSLSHSSRSIVTEHVHMAAYHNTISGHGLIDIYDGAIVNYVLSTAVVCQD